MRWMVSQKLNNMGHKNYAKILLITSYLIFFKMQILLCLYICSTICGLWLRGRNHFKPQANSQQSAIH